MPEPGVSDSIPPLPAPPRRARWSAVLRWRWPYGLVLAILTFVLTMVTGIFWAIGGFGLPFDDWALDTENQTAPAQVTEVTTTAMRINNRNALLVRYRFQLGNGPSQEGTSYVSGGSAGRGAIQDGVAEVEYLPNDPSIHRLKGGHRQLMGMWLPVLGWLFLPCIALSLWHLRGLYRLKHVLEDGLTANARVTKAKRTSYTNPPQLVVDYEFVDRHGDAQRGSHWLKTDSPTGKRLESGGQLATVAYLDSHPKRHRLVGPETYHQ